MDATNHTVTCDTFFGTIKASAALVLAGSGPGTITLKGTLNGRTDDTVGVYDANSNPGGIALGPSSVKGTLDVASTSCTALAGLSAGTSGTLTTTWKTVAGNFQGRDNGAPTTTDVVTSQSVGSLLAACGSTAGLKAINLGLGIAHLG